MTGDLLGQAADFFKRRETHIQAWFDDDRGRYAFLTAPEGADGYRTRLVVTAKKYHVRRGDTAFASFMQRKVLERASDMDAKVVQFVADTDERLVFDPDAVLDHGIPPGEESKRRQQGEDWVDIPKAWSVPLMDYMDRRGGPRTEPKDGSVASHARLDDTKTAKADGGQQGLDRWA